MKELTRAEGHPVPQSENALDGISAATEGLIRASVSKNTLRAYRGSTKQLETWLKGRVLTDALLADYISELFHDQGKSPSTIALVVAAVQWREGDVAVSVVGCLKLTKMTIAGIRREGAGRMVVVASMGCRGRKLRGNVPQLIKGT